MPMHQLPFTREEYLSRIAKTRAAMEKAGLDLLVVSSPENILWLSGYQAKGIFSFQVLLVPGDGAVRLVTRAMETSNVLCLPPDRVVEEFATYRDTEEPVGAAAALIRAKYPRVRRIGVEKVSMFLSAARAEALAAGLDGLDIRDASHLVDRQRLVKSPAEIECFRRSAAITDAAVTEAIEAVEVRVSDREIAAVTMAALARHGSEYCATWPNVMAGWRGALAHAGWEGQEVVAGEPCCLEFAASVQRYHAPVFRTVICGEADAEVRKVADAALAAHEAGLAVLRPGVTVGEVDAAVRAVIRERDCLDYSHSRYGYTLGMAFPPTWAQSMPVNIVPGGDTAMEPGMLFHLLVYLIAPGRFGMGTSDSILIGERGIEQLTKSPKAPLFKG